MPRFYFEIETGSGVEQDTTGVDVSNPIDALYECLDVVADALNAPEFEDLRAVKIKDADESVVAVINVEAIRRAALLAKNGESSTKES